MQILHFTRTLRRIGGIETYVLDLVKLLRERGHENSFLHRDDSTSAPDNAQDPVHALPSTLSPRQSRLRLREIVRDTRPDVIYLHDIYDPELISEAAGLAPTVAYVHIFYAVCPGLAKLFRRGDRVCERPFGIGCVPMIYLRRCASARDPRSVYQIMRRTRDHLAAYGSVDRVLVASAYMRDLLLQNGFDDRRLSVLPYFIPIPESSLARGPDDEPPRILFAGRLEHEKGLPYLFEALRSIDTPYRLIVAGDGTRKGGYERYAAELGIARHVRFLGWLNEDELSAEYQRCRLTVMPTLMPEPLGKVGMEALAHGRPVVGFAVGGIPEWLADQRSGFLVSPGDVGELATRIEELLASPSLADRLGANGRAFVESGFRADAHIDQLITIFAAAIAARR